jgi:RNA polymerase sigma-70 factor (ECF subfamily)
MTPSLTFDSLYTQYAGLVAGIAARFLDDPADREDAVQQTWQGVWIHVANGQPIRKPKEFCGQVAKNAATAIMGERKDRRTFETPLSSFIYRDRDGRHNGEDAEYEPRAEMPIDRNPFLDSRVRELVRAHVETLPPRIRQITEMFYYANSSIEAIARELGLATGSVKWSLSEGRRILRDRLIPANKEMAA